MTTSEFGLPDEHATLQFGSRMARSLSHEVVYLKGPLGAGKTSLVRGILRGLGHQGAVKSPTYTLVEPYEFAGREVYHWDLYRIVNPAELEFVGLDELMREGTLRIIEWPERGNGMLPPPDIEIKIDVIDNGRKLWMTDDREEHRNPNC